MSLTTLTLLESATVTPSGGTAMALTSQGISNDKNRFVVDADEDLRTQRSLEYSVRRPKPQASAPNGYTQARVSGIFKIPRILANGAISVDTITISLNADVETTVAQKTEMLKLGAQMFVDSEVLDLLTVQNLG